MNGLQLQRQLAAADCRIPIIFITAYDDKETRRRAMQAGAIAFLGKPFSDEQLLHSIRLALHEFGDEPGAAGNLIAIIDDDESVRRSTARLIESFGFSAAAFESAESFLSSAQLECSASSSLTYGCPARLDDYSCKVSWLPRIAAFLSFLSPLSTTTNPVAEQCKPRCRISGKAFFRRTVTSMDSFSPRSGERRSEDDVIVELYGGKTTSVWRGNVCICDLKASLRPKRMTRAKERDHARNL